MTDNPLAGYFRKPAIHMTLPSGGQFYPPSSLEMPPTNELPVYPMTVLDDITYKTPDALFNGSAIVDVIKSCIPSIIDPWQMSAIDLPAILVSIRIASSGHMMEIDTQCPKCNEVATYEIDLRDVSDNIVCPDFSKPLVFGDIQVFLKPLTYEHINENSKSTFDEQQLNKTIADTEMPEADKIKILSAAFNKIHNFSISTLAHNINYIVVPEATVSEFDFILDFLRHCEKAMYNKIKDTIIEQREMSEIKPIQIKCDNKKCGYEYEQPFTMDMTTFFE